MDSNNKKIITTALAADFIAVLLFIFALQTKISIIIILFYIINHLGRKLPFLFHFFAAHPFFHFL